MRRREVVALIGGAALVTPAAAPAEASKPRLATLAPTAPDTPPAFWEAFWDGMRALGHPREAFDIEARWADGHPERLSDLGRELAQLAPRVIVCFGSEAGVAAKQATATIAIVLAVSSDPVGIGLVAGLARPGGNVTGLSLAATDVAGKHIEMLKLLVPHAQRVALLVNAHDPAHAGRAAALVKSAQIVQIEAFPLPVNTVEQIGTVFTEMAQRNADALIILGTPMFNAAAQEIGRLVVERKVPTVCDGAATVRLGAGVMGYGADVADLFRRSATYVDKILQGAKAADLPVEQPTKFELVINLKTANALGLTVPQSLLARADEVIE
jgi:putative ABC transport system substrate-binding protein